MDKEFKLPQLSEGVESATVAQIMVSEGDQVEEGQIVFELETEKASAEVPCDVAGTVSKVHVAEGDEADVGQTMLTLEEEGPESADQDEKKDEKAEQEKKQAPEEYEAEKKEERGGEKDEQEEPEEHETEAPKSDKSGQPKKSEKEPADAEKSEPSAEPAPAAPSVRRFAREIGVDIDAVEGSGPNGRISIDDVKAHSSASHSGGGTSASTAPALPDFSKWGEIERKPMDKIRRLTAEQMVRSANAIPQAVQFGKANIQAIDELHDKYQEMASEAGGHLSLTVVLVKALAGALKHFPRFNASIDAESEEIVYKNYIHIGIAMDTGRGLLVPVLRNCNQKSIIDLSVELKEMTRKARDGKLQMDDMKGANMTISNAGALGGDLFIPIVSWPESAILGVAKSRTEAVFEDGSFNPKPMLPLSLAYDHRLNDGADSVRFLQWIIDSLENPLKMAVEG